MKKLNLGFGGHPLKNDDFNWMQDAYAEVVKAIISIFDPSLNIILSGFVITDNGTTISCTSGSISWQGEIYQVSATSFVKVSGQQLYLKLIETTFSPSPVTYKDGTNQNVHVDRTLQFKYFDNGDTGEYYAAFTRTSSLGFKRGMILDYIGNTTTSFDQYGLGINDMAGFAICNGNTFTISGGATYTVPDIRGKNRLGASNVPNQDAPTYDSTNLGTPNISQSFGSAFLGITKENLPNYNLTVTDNHYHFNVIDEQIVSGNFPNEIGRGINATKPMITSYSKSSGGGKESYTLCGSAGNFPSAQPTVAPTSYKQGSITVSTGGSGTKLDIRGGQWVGIPIIKL